MVYCCSVIGCYNLRAYNNRRSPASPRVIRNEVDQGVRFFRFPTWKRHHGPQMEELTKRRRLAWLSAVRRKDLTFHDIPQQRRVCSRHFHKGKPAMEMFESDPDWAPSLHLDGSDQCVESRLQVKMNSPDADRDISIQQEEPEDHLSILHMFVCKEEVIYHGQERSPSLLQVEPEPPHINGGGDTQEEILQRPEEPDGSMLTFLAVKSEVDKDISSHFSEVEVELEYDTEMTDDNDDLGETERVHTREKPFHCKHCNKSFTQSSHLTSHQHSHTGERPFQCKQCDKSFTWSASLKRHQHVHSHTGEKRFLCTHCDKSFASSENLRRHELGYTGYRPHPCTLCDKRFIMSADLKLHQRVHTGEKPFQCKHCDKRFTWRPSLKSHRCICNGEKTFDCKTL